jgi:uncharacterized protein with FMN-binding domain
MWVKVKKVLLSLSVVVLFALYALQRQAQPAGERSLLAASFPATTIAIDQATATSIPAISASKPTASSQGQKLPTASAHERTLPTATALSRSTSTMTPTATATSSTMTASHAPTPVAATGTETASGAYQDGTYTGIEADAHWGTVQVLAVISDGQISDVQFTDYPNHRSRSVEINRRAIPMLVREAMQSQQADVDIVSGATDTSEAFMQSLDSALRRATS